MPAVVRPDPKRRNLLYHNAAARTYDRKWAISFDERSIRYVRDRAERMLPRPRYARVLEIGSGTGFFLLNLWQAGYVGEAHATDISPGMLAVCVENARRIGCDLRVRTADAEGLPYPTGSFDLVIGHAVLHHLPSPPAALAEVHRVLAPGGAVLVAGEPSRAGDRRAKAVGRLTSRATRAAARFVPALRKAAPSEPASEEERVLRELEWDVDLHTFIPSQVEGLLESIGFEAVRVETEELVSSVWGWAVRTFEAEVPSEVLGSRWAGFAYRSWIALYAFDRAVLYPILSKDRFYNLLLYGERPA